MLVNNVSEYEFNGKEVEFVFLFFLQIEAENNEKTGKQIKLPQNGKISTEKENKVEAKKGK